MSNNRSGSVIVNFIWRFAERCGARGITFVVSILLARLLTPEDYGTIALITVITNFLDVFVDSGLGAALIQKKDADDLDYSSVFYVNICMCAVLYVLLYVASPWIARFYGDNSMISLIRVLGLVLFGSGIGNVHLFYVSKKLIFQKRFFATLGGTFAGAVIGIALAYLGFGVWALVVQQLTSKILETIILWITVDWRPKRMFSMDRTKTLLQYGWKLMASSVIDIFYDNLQQMIVGKFYSLEALAYYTRGEKFPNLIADNVSTTVDGVLLPMMAEEQDDRARVKEMTKKAIKTSTYIMAPLMVGLAVVAEPLVLLLLTEKWMPSVFFMRVTCANYIIWSIHSSNLNAIKAMGRGDLFLKMEILKKLVCFIPLMISIPYGVKAMVLVMLFSDIFCMIINAYPNKNLLNYGIGEQIKDILPHIILSGFMGIPVYFLQKLSLPLIAVLLLQIFVGAVIYVGLSCVFKVDTFLYLINTLKRTLMKNTND